MTNSDILKNPLMKKGIKINATNTVFKTLTLLSFKDLIKLQSNQIIKAGINIAICFKKYNLLSSSTIENLLTDNT